MLRALQSHAGVNPRAPSASEGARRDAMPVKDEPGNDAWIAACKADCEWLAETYGGHWTEYMVEMVRRTVGPEAADKVSEEFGRR